MRARYPEQEGFVERDGVKIFYEVFGAGERLCPRAVSAPRRVRSGSCAGWPDNGNGTDGKQATISILPLAPPFRAEFPCSASACPLPGRSLYGL